MEIDPTIIIVFILAYLLAYLMDILEVWVIVLLFFIIYFAFTEISFDFSEVGFDFTVDYYIKILYAQTTNYIASIFGDSTKDLDYPVIETDFVHKFSGMNKPQPKRLTHQSIGSCPIDVHGNNIEYVYVGGGKGQDDALLMPVYNNENGSGSGNLKLKTIKNSGLSDKKTATYSAIAFDMTGNGAQDLIVSRQNGVYIYENLSKDGKINFAKHQILGPERFTNSTPLALAIGDVNMNRKPDILISQFTNPSRLRAFQFNNDKHWAPNILLENEGKLEFIDSTEKYNLTGVQNTFTSSFVVLDRDFSSGKARKARPAQVINSNDTGKMEIYSAVRENDNYRYNRLKTNDQIFPNGFWMGLAIGDIDNDGRMDIFSTNLGKDIPLPNQGSNSGTRGTQKYGLNPDQYLTHDHMLLMNGTSDDDRNNNRLRFFNKSKESGLAVDGIGWGCVFEDFTLNGRLDLFYAQNYIDMGSLTEYDGGTYVITNDSADNNVPVFEQINMAPNSNYAHTPMFCDFGKTGLKDLIWVNINGPLLGYANTNINNNNFITIRLPKNIEYLNASVVIMYKDGKIDQRQNIVGGIGLSGDQSSTMVFGLGDEDLDQIQSIKIHKLYGEVDDITKKIKLNKRIIIS